jgi:YegS/Rv2252/BmrU family lipid kinase
MLPFVIVNPKSAAGATREKWSAIASDIRTHFGPFSVAFTKARGDAVELAKRAAVNGRNLIIACGGDGTINEVANGIIQSETDAELGILPSGTGGDFRRSLNIPHGTREAARALRESRSRLIDVGRVAFRDHDGEEVSRYFLNVSSVGLAASIIGRVKASPTANWMPIPRLKGTASFAISTLHEVIGVNYSPLKVKLDETDEYNVNTINFCVANARYFGGGMLIAPHAKLDDGYFDVVNIGDLSTWKIFVNAYTLYRGTHLALDEVKSTKAKRLEIRPAGDETVHLETDGELPGRLPAVYEVVPKALTIRVPSPIA